MKTNTIEKWMLVMGFAGLTACADSFLDVNPITDLTEDSFYLNAKDAERALVGCYDGFRGVWEEGVAFPVASEILSDNCFGGTGKGDGNSYKMLNNFDKATDPGNDDVYNTTWINYYKAIYRINKFLTKLPGTEMGEEERNRIEGEVRFLRAYCYFDMTRLWGTVPLKLEPTDSNDPQAAPEAIFAAIGDDLKWAADHMNSEKWSTEWATSNDGHATGWAAKALLGRVFLFYTGYYGTQTMPLSSGELTRQQVLAYMEDVIQNGGFDLVAEYRNLWLSTSNKTGQDGKKEILMPDTYAGEGNSEIVFAVKYNNTAYWDSNTGSNKWLVMIGIRGNAGSPYGQGWGACTVNPRLVDAFGSDPRKTYSVIDIERELPGTGAFKLKDHIADMQEYTGYANKKYTPLSNPDGSSYAEYICPNPNTSFMICQFQDYFAIRYADVLLMAAELGSANAQTYFDQVRSRAYAPATAPALAATSANILQERRFEFAFEGLRYWDLLRTGVAQAASVIEAAENGVSTLTAGSQELIKLSAAKINETKGLQQIPNTQITLSNGILKQNAGW